MRITLLVICGFALLATCRPARADDQDAARKAFERGTALYSEGKYEEAALAFREANRLRPNWRLLYNIGQSEAAAKFHGLALEAFEEYLSEGGDEVPDDRRQEVADEIARLRGICGEIVVKAPNGAVVSVDGRERGTAPLPGPLLEAAGKLHRVVVVLDGQVIADREIRVGSGRSVEVDAAAQAAPGAPTAPTEPAAEQPREAPAAAAPAPPAPEAPDRLKIAGWVSVGVGAAALIGSAVTGGMALRLDGELDEDCPDLECGPSRHDDVDRLRSLSVASDVLTGVGTAALAAGVVMVIVSAVRGGKEEATSAVGILPAGGPGTLALVAEGRF